MILRTINRLFSACCCFLRLVLTELLSCRTTVMFPSDITDTGERLQLVIFYCRETRPSLKSWLRLSTMVRSWVSMCVPGNLSLLPALWINPLESGTMKLGKIVQSNVKTLYLRLNYGFPNFYESMNHTFYKD